MNEGKNVRSAITPSVNNGTGILDFAHSVMNMSCKAIVNGGFMISSNSTGGRTCGRKMFWRFFRKPKDSETLDPLPDFKLDLGQTGQGWTPLSGLSLKRDEFLGDDPYDVWTLTFEKHAFMMIFNPAGDDSAFQGVEQFATSRLVLALVRNPGEKEFEPPEGEVWSEQIEYLRGNMLPKLNDLLRRQKSEASPNLSNRP